MVRENKKKGLIVKKAEFVTSASKPSEYPASNLPEIAFAGRSNVGKSSLINALVNRKKLVKTSNTPGRTQRINFFEINDSLRFVDLPGYGYAKVSKKMRAQWKIMIETYLETRINMVCLVWLMDIRREPAEFENNFGLWLDEKNIDFINVLTKADKFSKTGQLNQRKKIASKINYDLNDLIIVSSIKKIGISDVWDKILSFTGAWNES
ncbi:MAG: YihA family ribosome biogenesis GTP-binding protein [Deltaproteobacteria bacterium]|nr:MAG: YihA family ribosome biogenesis GTP-binding protein [Deltaproteobacteria bacterium]